jgi:RimJ/RimL family protein N-acetyltransferase
MSRKAALGGRCLRDAESFAESLRERDPIAGMHDFPRSRHAGERLDFLFDTGLSLGWRTDLIFARFDGEVVDRGDHLRVLTPANPTFWWGNFLLFQHAPRAGDLDRWMALFDDEIAALQPESRHRAFGVDVRERLLLPPDFAAAGFTLSEATVLTLTPDQLTVPRRPWPDGLEFRVLELPRDSAAVVDKQVTIDPARHHPVGYREFATRQMARYAAMQHAGLGHWFGLVAQVDGQPVLAASCGLFRDPARSDGLGRFQYVSTHPDWRRRGLCTALVHAACRHGFEAMGLHTLVMVADPDDVAIGVYESLGYRRGASTWQFERAPP